MNTLRLRFGLALALCAVLAGSFYGSETCQQKALALAESADDLSDAAQSVIESAESLGNVAKFLPGNFK